MMLKNYLVTAVRGFARDRVLIGVAIFGLAIAIAISLFVTVYVKYELSYDSWVSNGEFVYRLESDQRRPNLPLRRTASAPAALIPFIRSDFDNIEAVSVSFGGILSVATTDAALIVPVNYVDPEFFEIFDLVNLHGNARTAILDPRSLILTEREARRIFGVSDVVGKTLTVNRQIEMRIGAVIANWPRNSNISVRALVSNMSSTFVDRDKFLTRWGSIGGSIFIKFSNVVDIDRTNDLVNRLLAKNAPSIYGIGDPASGVAPFYTLRVRELRDLNLASYGTGSMVGNKRGAVAGLVALSILILMVGAMNIANLLAARAKSRDREFLVRRTLGATSKDFVTQFLVEAGLLFGVATILSLVVTIAGFRIAAEALSSNVSADWTDPAAIGIGVGLPIVLSLIVGLPTALKALGEPMAFQRSPTRHSGRLDKLSWTTISQFSISIILGSVALVYLDQVSHLQGLDLGFTQSDSLILWDTDKSKSPETLRTQIQNLPSVDIAGFAGTVPTDFNSFSMSASGTRNTNQVTIRRYNLSPEALRLLEIEPLAGRLFDDSGVSDMVFGGSDLPVSVLLTESAVSALGFDSPDDAVGETFRQLYGAQDGGWRMAHVRGVVSNLSFNSSKEKAEPAAIVFSPNEFSRLLVRIRGDEFDTTLAGIDDIWHQLNPLEPLQRDWLPARLDDSIRTEKRRFRILIICTIVAFSLSIVGLVAVASRRLQRMSKEIAIRQVVGATPTAIVGLALKQFASSMFVAVLLAFPASFAIVDRLLAKYISHPDSAVWSYITAAAVAVIIGAVVIVVQARSIANKPTMTVLAA